ncbi:aminopeptidase N-like isoform X2 [Homalodisca vitripennis]|uniref:aminopeptidase N-like isoform X1 n=1 Tax=Homalodisca vitripennis TaxID=197043 RepID=UPI001EEAB2F7|nr:aminopeptidase N-like isoform X1 [Homalodisca vitripennis]XP_046682394.1 aminopeptidase N-like isoform X2 [Homalodisca vitripennis]
MYFLLSVVSFTLFTPSVFGYYPERYHSVPNYVTTPNYTDYILPTDLHPTSYNLKIQPKLPEYAFSGEIEIQFVVKTSTDKIVIHANPDYITVKSISVSSVSQDLVVVTTQTNLTYEFLTINLNSPMTVDSTVTVNIIYDGILGKNMLGFYMTSYNSSTGMQLMGITQFESTYARRAFPCFDEPAYRAPFSINILRTADQITMSNMNIKESTLDPTTNMTLDVYEVTPSIPTYLVAFGVTDNQFGVKSDDKAFKVFAREAAINDSTYVVQMGQSILDTIGTFVGVPYPLPKMDVVAVPDFDAGAMENWGLTTYREKYVLYNSAKNSLRDKFGVLSVVAHEFGHQWFGDLVTPDWWNYAWLNEAFATYFEYTVPNELEKNWTIGSTMYVVAAVQYALDIDIGSPRAMTSNVWTPSQIDNSFDYVIYEKGGSVLRMIENFLTTDVWRQGLKSYLTANQDGTGTPEKLFSALVAQSKDAAIINDTLEGWTTQPGYPLITVTSSQVGTENITYILSQMPYAQSNTSSYMWNVPIVYTSQNESQFDPAQAQKHWLYPSDNTTNELVVKDNGWLIVNVDQIGFYRVNYDALNWNKLKNQLDSNFKQISSINRAQIIDDALHLARTGHLDYSTAFGLTTYLPKETELAPWNAFFVNMRFLINIYYNTNVGDTLQDYARRTMLPPFQFLLNNLEANKDNFLFTTTVAAAGLFSCEVGLPDCQTFSKTVFDEWRSNKTYVIQPFVKQTVLCTGLQMEPTVEAFMDVWSFYLNSDNAAEKLRIMYAMGCVTNTDAIKIYLDAVTDTSANYVRLQDRWIAFRSLAGYQTGVIPVLQYIAANYTRVSEALGPRISAVISTISQLITQDSQIKIVHTLLNDTNVDAELKKQLQSVVIPAIDKRQAWASTPQAMSLSKWVDDYVKSSSSVSIINIILLLVSASVLLLK